MNHIVRRLGLCSGLMATSLAAFGADASAGLHSFAESMVYANVVSATPLYVAFLPNGNQSTDSVLLLELTQGFGTAPNTWQYYVSTATLGAAAPGMVYSLSVPAGSDIQGSWTSTTSTYNVNGYGTYTMGYGVSTSALAQATLSTFYGAVGNGSTMGLFDRDLPLSAVGTSNGEIALPFSYTSAASSQTCSISFNVFIDNQDYLQYVIAGVNAANGMNAQSIGASAITTLSLSSAPYTAQTAAGSSLASLTGNHFDRDFLGVGAVSGTSYPVTPAYTYFGLTLGSGTATASATVTPQPTFQAGRACTTLANQRLALNSNGAIPEFRGFFRIW
ncbi:MAG: hypothetical protein JO142_17045 [Burkholderiales bacterium]|nr:hypothetical protein [Burkholderiales bacterium]